MKKSLLLILLMTLLAPFAMRADEVIIGNEAATTSGHILPVNTYFHYSLTQQLYTAEEIGMAGTINSISFYYTYTTAYTLEGIQVYMQNSDKVKFATNTDMAEVEDGDLVFEGALELPGAPGWVTITLDNPFAYDGSSNLLICVYDPTHGYQSSSANFRYTAVADSLGLGYYSDTYLPDPSNITTYDGTKTICKYRPNIMLDITPGGGSADCPKPEALTVSDITARTAHFSMTGNGGVSENCVFAIVRATDDEPNWAELQEGEVPFEEEAGVDVDTLQPNTSYKAYLRAFCGDWENLSGAKTVSFKTPISCNVNTTLKAETIERNGTQAVLSWLGSDVTNDWIIEYSRKSDLSDSVVVPVSGDTATILSNLLPDSTYYARIKADCGEYDGVGPWSNKVTFMPTEKVIIGSGTSTTSTVPMYDYYYYSISQQIYTAEELGSADAILSIDFYKPTYERTRTFDIYMVHTNKSEFTSTTDWITVTAADKVFSGTVTFAPNTWTTIVLDRAFIYDGQQNVAIIVDDNTASDESSTSYWRSFSTSSISKYQAIYKAQDNSNINPLDLSSVTGTRSYSKNQIRILKGDAPTCFKPQEIASPDSLSANGGAFHWTLGEDETQWQWTVVPKDSSTVDAEWALVDTMYAVVGGLEPNTAYDFHVRSYCSASNQSDSRKLSFRTDCAALDPNNYKESFDSITAYCWDGGNKQTDEVYYYPEISSGYGQNGTIGVDLYAVSSSTIAADSCYLIAPEFNYGEKSLKDYSISLYASSSSVESNYNPRLYVGAVSGADIETFELVQAIELTTVYTKYEMDFSSYLGAGDRIAFIAMVRPDTTGDLRAEILIDDIALFQTPSCHPLEEIFVSDLGRRSLVLNLLPKTGHALGNYQLVYDTVALDAAALESAEKILISDTNKYMISGLERETLYHMYVRTDCGESDYSEWLHISATTKGLQACLDIPFGNEATTSYDKTPWTSYNYAYTQIIYPVSTIGETGNISSITLTRYSTSSTTTMTNVKVYVGHTTKSTFSSSTDWIAEEDLTLVFDGSLAAGEDGKDVIPFTTPFAYNGTDNIVVAFSQAYGDWQSNHSNLYTTASNSVLTRRSDTDATYANYPGTLAGQTPSSNRPNINFELCYALDPCPNVSDMSYELVGVGTTEAIVRWNIENADYLSGFDVIRSTEEISDFTGVEPTFTNIQVDSIYMSDLTASTHYYMYVRANCQAEGKDEGSSNWVGIDFTTLADCPHVENLATELVDANVVSVSWNKAFEDQELHFAYIVSQIELDAAALASAAKVAVDDTLAVRLEELDFDTKYYIYVASVCGEDYSPWEMDSIQTLPACIQVRNLVADRIEHNRVVLSWQKGIFAKEALWEVGIVGQESEAITTADTTALLIGLEPATDYVAYVKAVCGEESKSLATTLPFRTDSYLGECTIVGNGTATSSNQAPISGYFGYERRALLFTPEDGLYAGNLINLAWYFTSSKTLPAKVYLMNTDSTTVPASFVWNDLVADATLIFDGDFTSTANDWTTIPVNNFEYTGGNLMVLVASNKTGSGGAGLTARATESSSSNYVSYYRKDSSISDSTSVTATKDTKRFNTMFCFEATGCPKVGNLVATKIEKTSAQINWEPMGTDKAWKVLLSTEEVVTDFSAADSVTAYIQPLTNLIPGTDYYYFVRPAGDCEDSWRSVHFKTLASCLPPSALEIGEITETSAAISWIDAYDVNEYVVAYGLKDSFNIADAATYEVKAVSGAKETILTDLLPNTAYKFAVKSVCSAEDPSVYTDAADFRTECEAIAEFPWVEDFESYTANTSSTYSALYAFDDPCWINEHISGSGNKLFELNAYSATDDNNATNKLRLPDQTSGTITRLTLPEMNIPSTGYQFELDIFRNVGSTSYPQEGIRIFAAHGNDTIELAFISRNYTVADAAHGIPAETASGWYTYELVIPDTCIGLCNIILQGESKYGSHTYMDNFKVRKAPTCFKPTDLAVSDITISGASFVWTPTGSETQWQWAIAAADEDLQWVADEDHIVSDDSIAIDGLEAGTQYNFYVRAYCAEEDQSDEATVSFKTMYTVPFAPEFTSTTFPSDWMRSNTVDSIVFKGTAMTPVTSGWSLVAASDIIDAYNFKMNLYSSYKYWLVTPAIVMPNEVGAEYVLDFDLALDKYSAGGNVAKAPDLTGINDRFLVAISADGGQTWLKANKTEWNNAGTGDYVLNDIDSIATPYSIDMTAYAGQVIKIGFYGESVSVSGKDNDIHVGHINLHVGEGSGTSIKEIDVTEKAMKFFRNGHIYILRNGVIYDATGQMVKRD